MPSGPNYFSIVFFFIFFLLMKLNARMMQPLCIPKESCITDEKGKLFKWEGGGVGVCAPGFEGLKIISARKDGGREGVPVPWSHRDKRISEWSGPALLIWTWLRMSEKRSMKNHFQAKLLFALIKISTITQKRKVEESLFWLKNLCI